MRFELVSPERRLAETEATAVTLPGIAGDLTAMPNHAPFLTVLRPGIVTVTGTAGTAEYFVSGGFAEISPDAVSVLAEEAAERGRLGRAVLERLIAEAEAALAAAGEEGRAAAGLRINDLRALAPLAQH